MSGLHMPPAEPPADAVLDLREQLTFARAELHEAQRIAALLDVDAEHDAGSPSSIARGVIERDLAGRRIDAWVAVLDRLRAEGRRLGLFE